MKRSNVIRYAVIIFIGALLNLGLYDIAHVFKLPMWIDNVGTAYAAVILEPAAGLLIAFVTNFYQAAFIYDTSAIIYYVVSAMAALSFGIAMRKNKRICWKRLPVAMILYILTATVFSYLLTLWRTAGIPQSGWERYFYEAAKGVGVPSPIAGLFGAFVLKVVDACVMALFLPILYFLTPRKAVNVQLEEVVTWRKERDADRKGR